MITDTTAGVDEVGRGTWAGPVVVAAVILPLHKSQLPFIDDIRDSKKLSIKKRQYLYTQLTQHKGISYALSAAAAVTLKRGTLEKATLEAMRRAVLALNPRPDSVRIDGARSPDLPMPTQAIIGGDGLDKSLSLIHISEPTRPY